MSRILICHFSSHHQRLSPNQSPHRLSLLPIHHYSSCINHHSQQSTSHVWSSRRTFLTTSHQNQKTRPRRILSGSLRILAFSALTVSLIGSALVASLLLRARTRRWWLNGKEVAIRLALLWGDLGLSLFKVNTTVVHSEDTIRSLPILTSSSPSSSSSSSPFSSSYSGKSTTLPSITFQPFPSVSQPRLLLILNQTSLLELLVLLRMIRQGHLSPTVSSTNYTSYEQQHRYELLMPFIFANVEFLALPFLGWLLLVTGLTVPVVRQWKVQARNALNKTIQRLNTPLPFSSTITPIYPSCYMSIEGRRSQDGSLSPYKYGAAVIATSAVRTKENGPGAIQIVPIVARGIRETLPYGDWLISPGEVTLQIHPSITVNAQEEEEEDAERVRRLQQHITTELRALAERQLLPLTMNSGPNKVGNRFDLWLPTSK
jgi:1-acyl-sn-glycerol-3-phosphate acyltransferase